MNFQEAIENLFSFGNSAEAILLGGILFITFLLGMLLWFLLAHLPQRSRSKKGIKMLTSQLDSLDKDHKELLEKHTVQSAKVQRLEEDAAKNEILLGERETKLAQIRQLYTHLETERDRNYSLAEAANRELSELKNLIKIEQVEARESIEKEERARTERDEALAKVEAMKGLIEEMETDRHAAELHYEESKRVLSEAQQELQEAKSALDALQKQFELTHDKLQLATEGKDENLLTELLNLESELIRIKGDKTELESKLHAYQSLEVDVKRLREERDRLQSLLQKIEKQKEELDSRLQQQSNMEQQLTDIFVEDEMLEHILSETRSVMESEGFYTVIDKTKIIEDVDFLTENLNQPQETTQSRSLEAADVEINLVEATEEEEESMSRALHQAENAMNLQGFFGEIEEAVLLESTNLIELDEEMKMERALDESAAVFEKSNFFNEIKAEELMEDLDLFELQLQQEPEPQARGLEWTEATPMVELSDEEEAAMKYALDSAEIAMQEEGLYGNINIDQQLQHIQEEGETDMEKDMKESVANNGLELTLLAEINQLLPSAEGRVNDDLKKINGIGTSIEATLHRLGIRTFEQIAHITEPVFVGRLTAALGLPSGSIERDQWVYQAKQLLTKQKINDLTKDIDLHKLFKK